MILYARHQAIGKGINPKKTHYGSCTVSCAGKYKLLSICPLSSFLYEFIVSVVNLATYVTVCVNPLAMCAIRTMYQWPMMQAHIMLSGSTTDSTSALYSNTNENTPPEPLLSLCPIRANLGTESSRKKNDFPT